MKSWRAVYGLVAALVGAATDAEACGRIGVLAVYEAAAEQAAWDRIADRLGGGCTAGGAVEFRVMSRAAIDDAVTSRTVVAAITDAAHLGLLARRNGVGPPLVSVIDDAAGLPLKASGGAIVVRGDDSRGLAALGRGRIVAADRVSLIGFQAQLLTMRTHAPPGPSVERFLFTGGEHGEALAAVLGGTADVAFVPAGTVERLVTAGVLAPGIFRVVAPLDRRGYPYATSTPLYPSRALGAVAGADDAALRALVAMLLRMPHAPTGTTGAAFGFTLPENVEAARSVARALREPPYDSEPEVGFQQIWHDHAPIIVAGSVLFAALLFLLTTLTRIAVRLRAERGRVARGRRQLEELLATLPDLVWMKDPEGRYLFCNRVFGRFFGVDADSLIGRRDDAILDATTAVNARADDAASAARHGPITFEETVINRSDSKRYLLLTTKIAVRDDDGLIGVLGVARDITGVRETESRLRVRIEEQHCLNLVLAATENLETPIDEMLGAVAITLSAVFLFGDDSCAAVEWQGRIHATVDVAKWRSILRVPFHVEGLGDGWVAAGYLVARPDRDSGTFLNEEQDLLVAVAQRLASVLARRREAEAGRRSAELLRESEARFRSLIENIKLPVLLSTDDRFVEVNPAAIALLGYSSADAIVGRTTIQISPAVLSDGRLAAETAPAIMAIPEGGTAHQFEWEHLRADGSRLEQIPT
jgi:PAS domain S-box-containing protein